MQGEVLGEGNPWFALVTFAMICWFYYSVRRYLTGADYPLESAPCKILTKKKEGVGNNGLYAYYVTVLNLNTGEEVELQIPAAKEFKALREEAEGIVYFRSHAFVRFEKPEEPLDEMAGQ